MPYNKLYQIQVWEGDCRLEKSSQIHILYVAQGACRLGLEDKSVPLGKGEVFLLNFRQEAQARLEPGSLLADLALDYFALCRTAGLPQLRFSIGGDDPGGAWHQELKARVAALLLASGSGGPAQAFHELGEFYFLAQLLLEHFLERQGEPGEGGRSGQLLALLRSSESAATLQESCTCRPRRRPGCSGRPRGRISPTTSAAPGWSG